MSNEKVKLTTMDGEHVEVDKEIACKSIMLQGLLEDSAGIDDEIPLTEVTKAILEKIIVFCTYINDKEHIPPVFAKPLPSYNLSDMIDKWYVDFVDLEPKVLFELVNAANWMNIRSLQDLTMAKVATLIKGKTIQETREFLNIENDFTPEEEAQVMDENRWAEESF